MVETVVMSRAITPTIRRWQLGQELRRHRDAASVPPAEAAREIGVSVSSLSRIETGKQTIKVLYVKVLAQLYNVPDNVRVDLVALAEDAQRPEWFATLARSSPDWFRLYLGYESAASTLQTYASELIPGLLQAADYTEAVIVASRRNATPKQIEQAIELRRGRQERVVRGGVELHAVLNEACLLRPVGGESALRDQLRRVAELSELPNVTVQVLPFRTGAHPAMTSPFTMLGFEDWPEMATVYLENGRGALYLEGRADLEQYGWRFSELTSVALDTAASRDLLVRVAGDL